MQFIHLVMTVAKKSSSQTQSSSNNLLCNYCKRHNHVIADCRKVKQKKAKKLKPKRELLLLPLIIQS